ncbi:hypothetical protein IC614_00240 [Allosphingosinicella flava]|uniref:Lipoprotein n=1 Tax=Allosphingosinicella flava TaxID=2771430 RepID=A0A7T2GJN0_9SPHN|nr:hypothetical protein [Sphingosinicella flava]QPQ55095.1 hypothetical protein IC614_00240 [Sphingosinicella flava]
MMRFIAQAAVILFLAACAPLPVPSAWTIQTSATAGTALVYQEGESVSVRFACRRNPVDFYVQPGDFSAVAGDPPLILRSGAASVSLQTRAIPGGPDIVEGTAPMSAGVVALMESPEPLTLSYGTQDRTLPASDAGLRARFVAACRQAR